MYERFNESMYPIVIIVISITLTSPGIAVNNLLRSAGYTGALLKSAGIALLAQIIISVITTVPFGALDVSAAKFASRIIYFEPPVYKLNKIGGFDIDRRALRLVGASIIISMVILSINIMITGPYSILIQYLVAFFSYLLFLRAIQAMDKKRQNSAWKDEMFDCSLTKDST